MYLSECYRTSPSIWWRKMPLEWTPSNEVDSAALELSGLPAWTEVPTGVGFCMLMRSDLLDLVGLDVHFSR